MARYVQMSCLYRYFTKKTETLIFFCAVEKWVKIEKMAELVHTCIEAVLRLLATDDDDAVVMLAMTMTAASATRVVRRRQTASEARRRRR